MNMKIIKNEKRICSCCMEEHEVKTVLVMERASFKNSTVDYEATCFFCENAEELYMNEEQMAENDIKLKDAYRKKEGLLTSSQIVAIRAKYGISQSDLCLLLKWGKKTITRYESHQVQDEAHDALLKRIDCDPEWFLSLLEEAKLDLSEKSYWKYLAAATSLYGEERDTYLKKTINADYAQYQGSHISHEDVINEFEELKKELLSNQNVKREYDVFEPENDIIQAMIDARIKQNITQKELSERTGITQADISKIEKGTRNLSLTMMKRIAAGLGMQLKLELVPLPINKA